MKLWKKEIIDLVAIPMLLLISTMYYLKVFEGGVKTSVNVKAWGLSLLVLGIITLIWRKNDLKELKVGAIILTSLLIILGINILLFDYLNIVVQYEDWIKRGMP